MSIIKKNIINNSTQSKEEEVTEENLIAEGTVLENDFLKEIIRNGVRKVKKTNNYNEFYGIAKSDAGDGQFVIVAKAGIHEFDTNIWNAVENQKLYITQNGNYILKSEVDPLLENARYLGLVTKVVNQKVTVDLKNYGIINNPYVKDIVSTNTYLISQVLQIMPIENYSDAYLETSNNIINFKNGNYYQVQIDLNLDSSVSNFRNFQIYVEQSLDGITFNSVANSMRSLAVSNNGGLLTISFAGEVAISGRFIRFQWIAEQNNIINVIAPISLSGVEGASLKVRIIKQ